MNQFRPLLGERVTDYSQVRFPVFASPKLDGIRAIWQQREFVSRTLKTIPNRALQAKMFLLGIPAGWDGELIAGDPTAKDVFRKTTSAVMSIQGEASDLRFFVFDNCEVKEPFWKRLEHFCDVPPMVVKLDQTLILDAKELLEYELKTLALGYEGVVLRTPEGKYKYGRSTLREQYLLKLKRFTDSEAVVVGFEELQHNANEASSDERGYSKRSSHAENLIPMGILGALVVEMGGIQFNVGTGFTEGDRRAVWRNRDKYLGKLAKIKYFSVGVKDKPRHPVFLGWRDSIDL